MGRRQDPAMMEFHGFVLDGVNYSDASVASLIIDANHKYLKWPELLLTAEEDDDVSSIPRERKIRRAIQNYYEWLSKNGMRDELRVAQHARAGVMVDELDDLTRDLVKEANRSPRGSMDSERIKNKIRAVEIRMKAIQTVATYHDPSKWRIVDTVKENGEIARIVIEQKLADALLKPLRK